MNNYDYHLRSTESSHRMMRSRSEMGRIEWIDNDDEDDEDDDFDPPNRYERSDHLV